MKKIQKKQDKNIRKEPLIKPLDMLFGLIVLAYIFIPTFTPNWMSLDTNTPKFFMTAALNLVVFLILLFSSYFKNNTSFISGFFTGSIGIIYSGFLFFSLLSFTQAINLLESVLQFAKVFTVFASAFSLAMILMYDLRFVKLIVVVMTGLLLFDALSVFANINKFILGEIKAIAEIKTVYSNKNILASAIYVKLPFALWLMVFEKNWLKWLGWVALAFGVTATFFMATRAFYLGLSVISVFFIGYNIVVYIQQKKKPVILLTGLYLAALILAYATFSFVQTNLYPRQKKSRHTQGVIQQLATLKNPETASKNRSNAWKWSWKIIKEKPLLGIGSGNWKVDILKHENQKNAGFIYIYKAHNDFIETTTETGVFGGLLYLGLFFMIIWKFLKHYSHKKDDPDSLHRFLFLAASGVTFYAVDAFFNFPADRPEITALFAIFVATGIAADFHQKPSEPANLQPGEGSVLNKTGFSFIVSALAIAILAASAWILYLNFQSSKTQRIVYQEIMAGSLKEPSQKIIAGFPFIPNVSVWGEPVETLKARYLIQEEKYEEAIEVLRKDESSPWDARREFFMAMAYNNMKAYDSALYYSQIAAELKPNYFRNLHLAAMLLERKGENEQVAACYDNFLANNKKDSQAWLMASNFYIQNKEYERANVLIEEALQYLKYDTLIQKQQRFLNHKLNIEPNLNLFNKANESYQAKRYKEAIEQLNEFIELVPDYVAAYQVRAFSFYHLNDFEKCIEDANKALKLDPKNSSLLNLRGVCHRALNDLENACKDFERSMKMGNENGKTNYERFCAKK